MNLNAPTQMVFLIAVVLAALGVIAQFVALPVIGAYSFWLVVAGFVLLAAGNMLKGL